MNGAFWLYPVHRSMGAPHLARFMRDVGYRNCLLTHAPSHTESSGDFFIRTGAYPDFLLRLATTTGAALLKSATGLRITRPLGFVR